MASHKAIHNLGKWAHPPKTNVGFAKPPVKQTEPSNPKAMMPKGDKGKHSKHPGMR